MNISLAHALHCHSISSLAYKRLQNHMPQPDIVCVYEQLEPVTIHETEIVKSLPEALFHV
jgi:hypothetical protein